MLHHHERIDGGGYPHGLRGDGIPLESRIIHVADAFEAMTSDRPYRRGMPEAPRSRSCAGTRAPQFDPGCASTRSCAALAAAARPAPAVARPGCGGARAQPRRARGLARARGSAIMAGPWPPSPSSPRARLTKSFGGRAVLRGLDLDVAEGSRIGVLGPNGGGKSTLLRILAGLEYPDAGAVTWRRGLVHAFLPQLVPGDAHDPVATVLAARPELAALEADLERAEARLAEPGARRRPRRDGPRARPPGAPARPLGRRGRRLRRGRGPPSPARAGDRRGGPAPADPRAVGRPAQARRARRVPGAPARTCSCSTSRRPTST